MWQLIKDYIQKKYRTAPDFPFSEDFDTAVFRHADNRKWFALVMDVTADKVGLSGKEKVTVMNLKVGDPVYRDFLIREGGILPAYHMNKMHWITVRLDGTVPEERIFDLIDMSYLATASSKEREKGAPLGTLSSKI